MAASSSDYLKPINLSKRLWCYADDRGIDIIVHFALGDLQISRLTWKRLDRLRKQAVAARGNGKYKP